MKYQLQFDKNVKKILQHLPPLRKKQMKEALRCLALEPCLGKELQEELTGLLSLRVGIYRIIYKINSQTYTIHVIAMGPRHSIYEECKKTTSSRHQKF